AIGLMLSTALVFGVGAARVLPTWTPPSWLAVVVPPIVYACLVFVAVRHVSALPWGGATVFLCLVHVIAGVLYGAVVSAGAGRVAGAQATAVLPPALLPALLWVPLLLVPMRDPLARGSRRSRGHVSPHQRSAGTRRQAADIAVVDARAGASPAA